MRREDRLLNYLGLARQTADLKESIDRLQQVISSCDNYLEEDLIDETTEQVICNCRNFSYSKKLQMEKKYFALKSELNEIEIEIDNED